MANQDGEVLIGTKINTEGAEEGSDKIKKIMSDTATDAKTKAAKIANVYREAGDSQSDAMKKAWAIVKGESDAGTEKVLSDSEKLIKGYEKLPESYRTIYDKIQNIREDDALDSQEKADKIAELYEILGQSQEKAMQSAWYSVRNESEKGTNQVVENLEKIARKADESGESIDGGLGNALGGLGSKVSAAASSMLSGIPGGDLIAGAIGGIASALTQKAMETLEAVGKAVVKFSKEAIEMASDLQEVENVVEVTFPHMTEEVDKFAKEAIKSAGLSETMAKKYTGTFGAMAKSFGFTEKEAFDMSTTMTQLTGDVASFYNLDHDEAYTKLKAVFTGETEALKDLGIVMTQTALDQYAMEKGIGKTTAQMTEQEKVSLRYQFILEQLNGAAGDFARTEDSWANQTKILSEQWNSFQATVGEGLMNVFLPFLKFTTDKLMPALQVLGEGIRWVLDPEIPEEYSNFMKDELFPTMETMIALNTYGYDPQQVETYMTALADSAVEMEKVRAESEKLEAQQQELQQAIEATTASVESLKLEYEEARESAKKSIDQQVGLLTELETKSDKTAREIVDNWKKQQAALQNYSKNMQKAIDMGYDEAFVQQLSDGTVESMQVLDAFVNDVGINVEEVNREFQGVQKSKDLVASTMADMQTGTSRKLQQMASDTESQWGKMSGVVGASIKEMQEHINSLTGRQVYVDVVGRYNGSTITNAYGNPYGGGYNPYSYTGYTVENTSYVPYLAEGAVIPPNAPFTAVLGDQRNGYNLEGPEDMFRQIVREELDGSTGGEVSELLWNILQVLQAGTTVSIDGSEVFQTVVQENNRAIRRYGKSPLK